MKIRDEKGAALVEFALILPVLLMILMGIIEFGIIMYDKALITNASREAARQRILHIARPENDIRNNIVASYGRLPITFGSDTLTAGDITFASTNEATGIYRTATVSFRYNFLYVPLGGGINLTSSTTMRQEQ